MALQKYIRQLRPIQENKVDYVDIIQVLRELTISPFYQQKGTFNPFYVINPKIEKMVKDDLPEKNYDEILFKSVEQPKGNLLLDAKGKFLFQIVIKRNKSEIETNFYIKLTKKLVQSHYGMKQRKDTTASSNVNELLTVFFLANPKSFTDSQTFMYNVAKMSGSTNVYTGDDKAVTYEDLVALLDKDETPERDINIGYQNSLAVAKDVSSFIKLYWTPRGKPAGIGGKNPSDVILQVDKNNFIGYSNKITTGKDKTPKINTNVKAFFEKVDSKKSAEIIKFLDDSWNEAASTLPITAKNAVKALRNFDISKEKPSETASKKTFALLAKQFQKDKLNFYTDGFYYDFRNNFIKKLGAYLTNATNLNYFLTTIGYYTYDDVKSTPCPYKLLIGTEKGSTIKDVSSDEDMKLFLLNDDATQYSNIKFVYKEGKQSFDMTLKYKLGNYLVTVPITARTRAAGGWSGKALYITSPGIELVQ